MLRYFKPSRFVTDEEFHAMKFPAFPDDFNLWDKERKEDFLTCILYTVVEGLDYSPCFDSETAFETIKHLPVHE